MTRFKDLQPGEMFFLYIMNNTLQRGLFVVSRDGSPQWVTPNTGLHCDIGDSAKVARFPRWMKFYDTWQTLAPAEFQTEFEPEPSDDD